MKTKFRFLFSIIFGIALVCLAFSFVNINVNKTANASVQKGGAIYLASGATYEMKGGTISGHSGVNGGAVYVASGATFRMTGGTITNCSATNGGAIYVASGGYCYIDGGTITGNTAENAPAIYVEDGGVLEVSKKALITENYYEKVQTTMNFYVDGAFSKTLTTTLDTYTPNESDLPLAYENCCGYFLDEDYIETFGDTNIDMRLYPSTINLYTKTASDTSNFKFTLNSDNETYTIAQSANSISGDIVMPKQYDNKQISIVGEFNGSFIFFTDKVTGFTLPAGVTSIKSGAFGYRENVTYINLPDTITSLNMGSFESCSGLSKLIISKNITSLNLSAWYMFSKPANNIQQIIVDERNSVFDSRNNCNAIINTKTNELVYGCKTTTIVEGIKSIGNRAFYMCTSLNSITIPSSVESINQTAFSGCSGVTSIVVNSENQYFDSRNNCNAIIRKNDNLIVRGCNNTDLSVLSRVTVIGQNAFDDCSGLSGNLTIPNNITSIEGSAFENCSGLTGISIGNGLTSISNYAFSGCSGLTGRLIIPDSVTSIGWNAFQNCSGLTGLSIGNGITSIDSSTFESCRGLTGGLIIPSGVTSIGSSAFEYCSKLTSVYIPSSVTTITASSYAYAPFYTCSSSLVIYTDVANASSVPSGWSTYWNYYDSSTQLTVNYGVSLETYKTTVGLAFAPKTSSDEPLKKDGDIKIDNNYLSFAPDYNPEAILNEEKEYVIIPKKTGE